MNSNNKEKLEIVDITKTTENPLLKEECNIIGDKKKWKRNCPKCNSLQYYSFKGGLDRAVKENRWCKKCKMSSEEVRRKIGEKSKGRLFSKESRKKMSNAHIGRIYKTGYKLSEETRKKLSLIHKMRKRTPLSEETKHKMRIALISNLKNKNIKFGYKGANNYNKNACNFIDKINKEKGWNLKHAENGGETFVYGYFIDGYDKEKNIVFEYDEKYHFDINGKLKQKDLQRQQNIINELNPNEFWRYNEVNNALNIVYKKIK